MTILASCAALPRVVAPAPAPSPVASRHLGELIRIRSDTPGTGQELRAWVGATYPAFVSKATREDFDEAATFTWRGTDGGLPPVVLMAHLDVVAAENAAAWTVDPFAGEVRDGFVWGRGALDDKGQAVAILEAVESLASSDFSPERTVVVALDFDEEHGGSRGAALVAQAFAQRAIEPYLVLDEGTMPTRGVVAGLEPPLALIGTAEKGSLTVELSANVPGGHSSMPPKDSAIGLVARAVLQLEEHQLAPHLVPSVRRMLVEIAPHLPLSRRLALKNLWLLEGPVLRQLTGSPTSAASVRTSTVPTTFQSGVKDNVLASSAVAHVNFRILQGDTVASVLAHVVKTVDDGRVTVRAVGLDDREPSPESLAEGAAWDALSSAVHKSFPDAVVSPGLVMAGTDSRYFAPFSRHVYRFAPFLLTKQDLPRIHGVDERLPESELARGVTFYRDLVLALTSRKGGS